MNDKALSNAELELTQRIQMFFPRGVISTEMLKEWNGCSKEIIKTHLTKLFSQSSKMPLLEFIDTMRLPATTKKFITREKFIVNTKTESPAKIAFVRNKFSEYFRDKIDEPRPKIILRYADLCRISNDSQILTELGLTQFTTKTIITNLSEIYTLIERQGNKENGVLLNNGESNIFYVRDIKEELRVVQVSWDSYFNVGWDVDARSLEDYRGWFDGTRIFFLSQIIS